MSTSLMKLMAPIDSMGSENTEMASVDDLGLKGFTLKEKQHSIMTLMSEPQTFSDEGTVCAETHHDQALTVFFNSQKSVNSSANLREESVIIPVLQMHATERLYTNIHNHYVTPDEAFEGKSRLKFPQKKYIPENKFVIGTNPPLKSTSIRLYDKALSEEHASIVYRDAKRSYFSFLLCQKRIQTGMTASRKFPTEIHLLILSYLGESTSFYIQDNGSRAGTYEKVSPKLSVSLKNDQEFQLSMDTTIRILQVENKNKIEKFEESKRNRNMIKKFMKDADVKIIGLEQEFSTRLTQELPSFRKNNSKDTRNLEWSSYFTFDISFLKLEVHEQRENKISKYLIFPMDGSFDYFIGRNECSDIFLSSPTCSRRHCKITYNENRRTWNIIDGAEGLPSLGGTWRSLQTISEKTDKRCSKETPINPGSKFRLGDNVYEFLYTKKKVKME